MVSDISEPLKKVCFQTEILGIFGNSRSKKNYYRLNALLSLSSMNLQLFCSSEAMLDHVERQHIRRQERIMGRTRNLSAL